MTTREIVAHLMAECLADAAPEVIINGACVIAQALFIVRWQHGAAALLREVSKS